ncbi:MAG: hypothetical protein GMKNLPBB_02072 [Myxococcota bacterium]|nr:hypothetical protein [Myxococcota bacterium]
MKLSPAASACILAVFCLQWAGCSDDDPAARQVAKGGVDSGVPGTGGIAQDAASDDRTANQDAQSGDDGAEAGDGAPSDSATGGDAAIPSTDAGPGDSGPADNAAGDAAPADGGANDGGSGDGGLVDAADSGPADAGFVQPELFDMKLIRDRKTAECSFTNQRTAVKDGVSLDLWNVTYKSYESINGELKPILIRGFAARPAGVTAGLPGIVHAHGLGGHSTEGMATGPAAMLKMFVIAYTGPGGGNAPDNTSEGLPSAHRNNYRIFDTIPDLRQSWFWGHPVAAMRAATCLESHPGVDPNRIGITGFSGGGIATLVSVAVDDRFKAGVALSGTGAWDEAVKWPGAWQNTLLQTAGLNLNSPEWRRMMQYLDARALLPKTTGKIMMVNGSTDEFFPLTAHMATFNAIPGEDKRLSFAANFDHGCYALTGIEKKENIEARADIRARGAQKLWFNHWFNKDPLFKYIPKAPVASVQPGPVTTVIAQVDPGGTEFSVEEVHFWVSADDALVWSSQKLDKGQGGVYSKIIALQLPANAIWYVDVQYKETGLSLNPERFSISSPAVYPAGFVAKTRNINTCLP